ncbi:MAG: DUF1554 domain-containing protein [Leptospiraceae bacterium]|nr:DUF1554 domain-containing protein [Leptospiraceae bacterium]
MKRIVLTLLLLSVCCYKAKKSSLDSSNSITYILQLVNEGTSSVDNTSTLELSFDKSEYQFLRDETVHIIPTEKNVSSCVISPTLPSGLVISSSDCTISGNVSVIQSKTDYTITAYNSNKSSSASKTISIELIYNLRMFVTNSNFSGTISNPDLSCTTDTNKPISGVYKAFLVSTTRRVCSSANCITSGISENIDWVLKPNTKYYSKSGSVEVISTSASGTIASYGNTDVLSSKFFWTGLNTNYTNSTNNCNNWTNSTGGFNGTQGYSTIGSNFYSYFTLFGCFTQASLLCVEQ